LIKLAELEVFRVHLLLITTIIFGADSASSDVYCYPNYPYTLRNQFGKFFKNTVNILGTETPKTIYKIKSPNLCRMKV
jgi:hypothetical protein